MTCKAGRGAFICPSGLFLNFPQPGYGKIWKSSPASALFSVRTSRCPSLVLNLSCTISLGSKRACLIPRLVLQLDSVSSNNADPKICAEVIDSVTKVAKRLNEIKESYNNVALNTALVASQLSTIRAALEALYAWRASDRDSTGPSRQLDEDLGMSVSCCAILIRVIDGKLDESGYMPGLKQKIKYLWLENILKEYVSNLEGQVLALQLLLTIFQCRTETEKRQKLANEESRTIIKQVRAETASLALGNIDSQDAASVLSLDPSVTFDIDSILLKSPAYKRVYGDTRPRLHSIVNTSPISKSEQDNLLQRDKKATQGADKETQIASVDNLASVLRDQGKHEAAEEIDRQAVKRTTLPSSSIFKDSDQSDSSETTSVASSTWSEFSKSSASSYASASDMLVAALDEVIAVFMSDEELRCLFAEAFTKQDRHRVSTKGARLLKWLGRRLVMAANTPAEKEAAKFFFSRRRDQAIIDKIAQGITTISSGEERQEQVEEEVRQQEATKQEKVELYLQQQMGKPTINLESEETPALTTETMSDTSSDSEDEDKDKQPTVQLNIDAVKLFLKSSDAFARFKEEFEDFINPFRSEAMWTKTLWNGGERVRFEHSSNVPRLTNIDKLKIAAEEKLGMPILWWPLKQPRKHLSSSKVRIIWICVGHRSSPHLESSTNQRARNVVMKHTQTSLVLKHEDIVRCATQALRKSQLANLLYCRPIMQRSLIRVIVVG